MNHKDNINYTCKNDKNKNDDIQNNKLQYEPSNKSINDELDNHLYHLFSSDNVPKDVNITLKNKITYEAMYGRKKIDLWWLPVVINTVIAFMGIIFGVVLYEMARIGGSYTIIPNIIGKTSELGLKLILMWSCGDMLLGWLATAIIIPVASRKHIKGSIRML
ncbi:MAG: hypothetical protein IJ661_09260 [Lachnospiraceae bacterium]|nr:hypothetical protein [Lachnospiraceae bacterium]